MRPGLATLATVVTFISSEAHAQTVLLSYPFTASTVGDVDADGVADLLTNSATQFRTYSTRTGVLIAQHPIPAPNSFAWLLGDAGDVDGDGRDDVFLGAGDANGTEVRVVSAFTGMTLHTFGGWPANGYSLWNLVARLDDINGDGKAEFMIGNQGATVGGLAFAGRLDVYDGGTGAIVRSEFGTVANQGLGRVKGVGDLNADGKRDYVLDGSAMLPQARSGRTGLLLFMVPGWYDAQNVQDLGDVDGDGHDDLSHEAPTFYKGASGGALYVVSGQSGAMLWSHGFQFSSPFGYSSVNGTAGDIDGDGCGDFVLAGMSYTVGIVGAVLSGRDFSVLLEHTGSQGYLRASSGDVNGDGVPDLMNWPGWGTPAVTMRVVSGLAPGVATVGQACPDSLGVQPVIGVGVGARLTRTMTINLSRAHPNAALAVVALGFSDTVWNGVPLPIDLGSFGCNGCQWFVAVETHLAVPMTGPAGRRRRATHEVAVPYDPPLLGIDVFSQWAIFEAGAVGCAGSVTRAMRTRVIP